MTKNTKNKKNSKDTKSLKSDKINYTPQQILELIQHFCLFDTDYMKVFFKDEPEVLQFILRIIMDKPDLHVIEMHIEHEMPNLKMRSLTIDIFAKDSADTYYNIELQKKDAGAHIRRARYHGSIMDTGVTPESTDWPDIPEVYIIFITENDVRGAGLPLYHIERCIQETGEFVNDGLHIIYVNGSYRGNDELGRLMEDFNQSNPDKMNYTVLAHRAKYLKGHKEGGKDMSIIREWIASLSEENKDEWIDALFGDAKEAGEKAGLKAGEKIGRKATASSLLKLGKLSNEEIAEASGLTIEEINEMSRQN